MIDYHKYDYLDRYVILMSMIFKIVKLNKQPQQELSKIIAILEQVMS